MEKIRRMPTLEQVHEELNATRDILEYLKNFSETTKRWALILAWKLEGFDK